MSEIKLKRKRKPHSEETKSKMREAALRRDKPNHIVHGFSTTHPKLFLVWETMRNRCNNPHREKYKDYGSRGICVCEEWNNSAQNFCEWALSNGYKEGLQIDRIDNDGNYCPENCRWVTPKENSRNRRNTKYLTLNGITKCVSEWCETMPISQYTIYWWYRKFGREYAEERIEKELAEKWNRRTGQESEQNE